MKPLVVEYLQHHTFRELEDEHGVCARFNKRWDLCSLNYDQILVKNGDRVAEQCRGMVIRPGIELTEKFLRDAEKLVEDPHNNRWKDRVIGEVEVLAWPMDRFYNLGDPAAAQINWSDAELRVFEKLDGTMIVLYWDPLHRKWSSATRSVPEADLPIHQDHMEIGNATFSDLFMRALVLTREALSGEQITWEVDGPDKVIHLNQELTYVFELTSPYNRVVVRYDEPRVTLLAARHTASGRELSIDTIRVPHVQRPKVWDLGSEAAVAAFVDQADPATLEGTVVCDSAFRRLKVKNKAWVLSSKAKDLVTCSRRSAIEAIILGKIDDVLPLVETSIADELVRMREALGGWYRNVDVNFERWKLDADGNRKKFAELVKASGDWSTPYFQMLDGRGNNAASWAVAAAEAGRLSASSFDTMLKIIGC